MSTSSLDRLLAAFAGRVHASSICSIQDGWRLTFPAFDAVTVHFVLRGSGSVRIGDNAWQIFAAGSVIIVPPHRPHALGDSGVEGRESSGGERCAPFGDGLVAFLAGDGRQDTFMVCGSMPWQHGHALGLVNLLGDSLVEDLTKADSHRHAFELMLTEVTQPTVGMQAMTEALMQQCLIVLLRQRLLYGIQPLPLTMPGHPRLVNAVMVILTTPGDAHSVESLATIAGMRRSTFAESFSRAFGQGPMEFVQRARLRAAARLLATTDLPVKVIATSVGYTSRSYFSRAFTAAYGNDPSAFRNRRQLG